MRVNGLLVLVSLIVSLVAFWNRNELPASITPVPPVLQEPVQTPDDLPPFNTRFRSIEYRVDPQYRYLLHGLVVSFRHHDGSSFMHRNARDHLNMLDVCVVWGRNVDPALLAEFSFWNGIFTCEFRTDSRDAWQRFDDVAVSNNHLLSDDPDLREAVRGLRVGDQIVVEGWLASYGAEGGAERGTSTTRTDTGNGACETIFVERFGILDRPANPWRAVMWAALATLGLSLLAWLSAPHRPY